MDKRTRSKNSPAARTTAPVVINGWTLLFWTSFRERWTDLGRAVQKARASDPERYMHAPEVKIFHTVRELVFKEIPVNPDHPQFRQRKTLGGEHTHWRRAKFHRRFRLFFRFHTASRTIIYAWLSDDNTLRKPGSHTDPYSVFHRMLERGAPPSDWDDLMKACKTIDQESE
ncbi:MAG: type II toxin-antitoxin system YhaV family toxin [Gemmatimonadota bacterium]